MSGNMFVSCQLIMERLQPFTLQMKKSGWSPAAKLSLVSRPQKQVVATIKKVVRKGRFGVFFRKSFKNCMLKSTLNLSSPDILKIVVNVA